MKTYLVAAGGSGAKTAEALIHLCGAGLGPETLSILSVDTDGGNGNLSRFNSTYEAYSGCRKFRWSRDGVRHDGTTVPFSTDVKIVKLSSLTPVSKWGLIDTNITPVEYRDVLDLFFTGTEPTDEQFTKCEKGFLARPNLGSLIMGKHLSDELLCGTSGAPEFLKSLRDDLTANVPIRLIVVGSVFGGTGASVLPVAPDSILQALVANQNQGAATAITNSWTQIPKSAVMLMPYFFPAGAPPQTSETVDPSRFLADTRNALDHYHSSGASEEYSNIYLIGADSTSHQKFPFCEGSSKQRNSPSIVELAAALACLEEPTPDKPIRILNPAENADCLVLDNLPWPRGEFGASDFALFLQVASFIVRHRDKPMDRGLVQFLEDDNAIMEIPVWPWAAEFLTDADGNLLDFKTTTGTHELAAYFLRLLLWTYRMSESRGDLSLVGWEKSKDVLPFWDALCTARKCNTIPDLSEDSTAAQPHPLVVTLATASISSLRALLGSAPKQRKKLKLLAGTFDSISASTTPKKCNLPIAYDHFTEAEAEISLKLTADYAGGSAN
jgi:hypothetical protein